MLKLHRVASTPDYTAGVVLVNGEPICLSLELPWRDNQPCISCIPAGKYVIDLQHQSPKFGKCWEVMGVEGRTHILFHVANRCRELLGCIAVGKSFGHIEGEFAVLNSRLAFNRLKEFTPKSKRHADLGVFDVV